MSEETKPKEETLVSKEKDNKVVWWSNKSPLHQICVRLFDDKGNVRVNPKTGKQMSGAAKFHGSRLELDLSIAEHRHVHEELQRSGLEGVSIFQIDKSYADTSGEEVEFHKMLRQMTDADSVDQAGGIQKVLGLFSLKELAEAGINSAKPDIDQLIMLAIQKKSLKSITGKKE